MVKNLEDQINFQKVQKAEEGDVCVFRRVVVAAVAAATIELIVSDQVPC